MPKIQDFTGQTFGIWRVLSKTNNKAPNGALIYKCINSKNKKIEYKSSSYLRQFKKRKSLNSTTRGRPRKWIIIKKPYIEEKEV